VIVDSGARRRDVFEEGRSMRKLWLALALCLVMAPSHAAEIVIGRHTVDFPLPAGFCEVTEFSKQERAFRDLVGRLQPPQVMVLLVAADCMFLRQLRDGKRPQFIGYLTVLKERQTGPEQPALTRAEYVDALAAELPHVTAAELEAEVKPYARQAGAKVAVQPSALLEKDADAAYSGLIVAAGGMKIAALSATTVLHGEGVSVAFYRQYASERTFNGMLSDARTLVGQLLVAEQGGTPRRTSPWSLAHYDPMLIAGAAGLMIGMVVLLVGALFMRRE
jgi:hypothetical protein